jgi:NfeD-like C-terminal, partner-binding
MFVAAGSVLLAFFVVPGSWGKLLVAGALLTAVSACLPDGWVKLGGERWKARCSEGASLGHSLAVEAIDQFTLIVAQPSSPARLMRERSATKRDRRAGLSGEPLTRSRKASP